MDEMTPGFRTVHVVGPPRTGTTVLGDILARRPGISCWVEPYFVWDRSFRDAPDDQRGAEEAAPAVARQIRRDFEKYSRLTGARWVIDKSPRNCLKIPFIRAVFPGAKFLVTERDGRDTVRSMMKEREAAREYLSPFGLFRELMFGELKNMFEYHPFWTFRARQLLFYLGPPRDFLRGKLLPQTRWDGTSGWGPRFPGWREIIDRVTPLEFCCHQWVHTTMAARRALKEAPPESCRLVRYEELVERPREILAELFDLLGLDVSGAELENIPVMRKESVGGWRKVFGREQLRSIGPILGPALVELGYERDEAWWRSL
ncbi:MAG: sulfotransferase [Candidatus Nitrospinota bacterium M3_3B_026]